MRGQIISSLGYKWVQYFEISIKPILFHETETFKSSLLLSAASHGICSHSRCTSEILIQHIKAPSHWPCARTLAIEFFVVDFIVKRVGLWSGQKIGIRAVQCHTITEHGYKWSYIGFRFHTVSERFG